MEKYFSESCRSFSRSKRLLKSKHILRNISDTLYYIRLYSQNSLVNKFTHVFSFLLFNFEMALIKVAGKVKRLLYV